MAKRKRRLRIKKAVKTTVLIGILFIMCYLIFDFCSGLGLSHEVRTSEDWKLLVVNRWNKLPKDYQIELTELSNGEKVDSRIYPALQEMFDAARAEHIYPVVRDGYRTMEEQQKEMDEKIQAYLNEGYSRARAEKTAEEWVALPGTSEHQLGIAVDINADKSRCSNEEVYKWLSEHAHQYGFILRYPLGKQSITGTSYEPWHYRYVGVEAAKEIYQQQICLEEYMKK